MRGNKNHFINIKNIQYIEYKDGSFSVEAIANDPIICSFSKNKGTNET